MAKAHDLKILLSFYRDVYWKRKKFELRKNDHDFTGRRLAGTERMGRIRSGLYR